MAAMVVMDLWLAQQRRSSELAWFCMWVETYLFDNNWCVWWIRLTDLKLKLEWIDRHNSRNIMQDYFTFPVNFNELEKDAQGMNRYQVSNRWCRSTWRIWTYVTSRSVNISNRSTMISTTATKASPTKTLSTSFTPLSRRFQSPSKPRACLY